VRRAHKVTSTPCAIVEALEPRLLLDGSLLITEFMASNGGGLLDGDGNSSDWIELYNPTDTPATLDGWYLTDNENALTKWPFPDPDAVVQPGEYLVVFASKGREDVPAPHDPNVDPAGNWHTSFKLDATDGEYLALVVEQAGQPTVVHAYDPQFPKQLPDISYGLPDTTAVWEQLVASEAPVAYHVPTAADADLIPQPGIDAGWTAPTFDDSAWADTIAIDPAGLLITETGAGEVRFVEVQNAGAGGIDTTGWQVVVNDASSGINAVHVEPWALPAGDIPAGAVLYGTDDASDAGADFRWSAPIAWTVDDPGWAMVIDDAGGVVDFVAWGYSEGEIASLDISFAGFENITVAQQWRGSGARLAGGGTPGAEEDVIAFGATWDALHPLDGVDPAGADPDFNSTWMQPTGYDGPTFDLSGPAVLGYGTIDMRAVVTDITTPPAGNRGTAYFRREFVLTGNTVNTGIEILSDDGAFIYIDGIEVARSNIAPPKTDTYATFADGYTYPDGTRTENRTETLTVAEMPAGTHTIAVSVHQSSATSSDLGFDLRLFGRPVSGGNALRRTGSVDGDTAADFAATNEPTPGLQNPDLTVPFGTIAPSETGVGFSADQPAFEDVIGTDVGSEMQGVNASLWTRIAFQVDDLLPFDVMTLRMKYDDGFAAYINGHEVARRNAPATLAYDSAAAGSRPDAQAVVFEDIDITEHLFGTLASGTNVLAIHALNVSAGDGDLLVLPELVAAGQLRRQYMTTPTPGQPNVPGAVGLVADTQFSVDRGFYDTEQLVAITTDTAGAEIRYTLDGSKPSETVGTPYLGPVPITTTTTLRAIAYKTGHISTNVDTHTYIFPRDVVEQDGEGFPMEWGFDGGPTGADYGIDPDIVGTHAEANEDYYDDFISGLTSIPTLSLVLPVSQMFANGGLYDNPGSRTMEKETSAELIHADGRDGFQVDAGLKMQGGASRNVGNSPKHSMSLRFRTQYGPGHLEFPLFEGSPVESFNSLQLRAVYNNSWIHWGSDQRNRGSLMRDQWMRDVLIAMGHLDAGHGQHVHLYIDGLYWGIYVVQERQEASHYAAYHGGDDDRLDALNSGSALDGNTASWNSLHNLVAGAVDGGISLAEFQEIQQKLDVVHFVDYMIINHFGGNTDWDGHNWRAAGGGPDNAPWRVYSWDAEHVMESIGVNKIGVNNAGKPSRLFHSLRNSDEFVLMFADRLHEHFFNGGVLTADAAATRWSDRAAELDLAMVAESARWGDYRRDVHSRSSGPYELYTRNDHWRPHLQWLMDHYFHQIDPPYRSRSDEVLIDYRNAQLYPDTAAPVFHINGTYQHGGVIDSGDLLSVLNPGQSGAIWYTLDGSDPRLPGGDVNLASAVEYADAVAVDDSIPVLARVLDDAGRWSPLNRAIYETALPPDIAITEINYNPADPTAVEDSAGYEDANAFEFIELRNIGSRTIGLQTVHFAEGIDFSFASSAVTSLDAGRYAVVVRNAAAFELRYGTGVTIAGQFTGGLDGGGEAITLAHGADSAFVAFHFDDSGDWPGRADGKGATLEIIDPRGEYSDPDNWRSSVAYGGTPGAASEPEIGVVINEVLTHTDLPQTDTIELHNTTGADIDIGGWFLSDSWGWASSPDNGDYKKFRVSDDTIILAGQYMTFNEADFNPSGGAAPDDFALSGAYGDDVWLMKADAAGELTHFGDHIGFGPAANGESYGRWPNASGRPYPMAEQTLGSANTGPRVGPVVIGEVHYHPENPDGPGGSDADDLEFIEIWNPTGQTVNLWETYFVDGADRDTPWTVEGFAFATGTSAGTSLAPGERLAVVPFDPDLEPGKLADFESHYGLVGSGVQIVGPYDGQLDNAGETVRLKRPDEPPTDNTDFVPYLLVDEVIYDDRPPWPTEPDTHWMSLNRTSAGAWGNDAASWVAQPPTPGGSDDTEAPTLDAWFSAAVHDGTELLLEIPDDGSFSEPRSGGITTLVLAFSEAMNLSGASVVLAGTDQDGAMALSGITAGVSNRAPDRGQILFSEALPDVARYLVRLDGAADLAGNALVGDNDRVLTGLVGDANGDHETGVLDLLRAWEYSGRSAGAGADQTRCDVDRSAAVDVSDLLLAWDHRGHDTAALGDPAPQAQVQGSQSRGLETSAPRPPAASEPEDSPSSGSQARELAPPGDQASKPRPLDDSPQGFVSPALGASGAARAAGVAMRGSQFPALLDRPGRGVSLGSLASEAPQLKPNLSSGLTDPLTGADM